MGSVNEISEVKNNMFLHINFVPDDFVDEILVVLNNVKNIYPAATKTCTVNGFQTSNLMNLDILKPYTAKLLEYLSVGNLQYRWIHFIEYDKYGYQKEHNHVKTEQYSYILYLTTCDQGGETFFKTPSGSYVSQKPEKNKLLLFNSSVDHFAVNAVGTKKILVGALVQG